MKAINNQNDYENGAMGSRGAGRSGLLYLLVGTGIGAAAALLLAPKSGADLRGDLSDLAQKGYGQTTDIARRVKEQSSGLYNTAREKAGDLLDLAGSKVSEKSTDLGGAVDKANDEMSSAISQLEEKFGRKDSNANHESSNVI